MDILLVRIFLIIRVIEYIDSCINQSEFCFRDSLTLFLCYQIIWMYLMFILIIILFPITLAKEVFFLGCVCASDYSKRKQIFMKVFYVGKDRPKEEALRVRNLKFATYLKFATCRNTNKINQLR